MAERAQRRASPPARRSGSVGQARGDEADEAAHDRRAAEVVAARVGHVLDVGSVRGQQIAHPAGAREGERAVRHAVRDEDGKRLARLLEGLQPRGPLLHYDRSAGEEDDAGGRLGRRHVQRGVHRRHRALREARQEQPARGQRRAAPGKGAHLRAQLLQLLAALAEPHRLLPNHLCHRVGRGGADGEERGHIDLPPRCAEQRRRGRLRQHVHKPPPCESLLAAEHPGQVGKVLLGRSQPVKHDYSQLGSLGAVENRGRADHEGVVSAESLAGARHPARGAATAAAAATAATALWSRRLEPLLRLGSA
mmetsp:Transcript_5401/g.16182  ORF Transcript_5401/g.16182 Transcript_5401/m.16182 type:complete len:307 (-) Transcript_5401:210-1130(-)